MATARQIKAIEKLSDFIRNTKGTKIPFKTLGEILREAGYSDSVSKSPQRVTERKGWNELMSEYFPEKDLIDLHKRILNKSESFRYKDKVVKTNQPHSDAKYALDMYYKLKGAYKYDPEKVAYQKPHPGFEFFQTDIACEFWLHNRYFRNFLKAKELNVPMTHPDAGRDLDHIVIRGYAEDYSYEDVVQMFIEKYERGERD
ncbi:MAG TPA: hypothetical protein PLV59_02110 [Candidatus Dojkabacteria bacterium]|nr:hypothetical protein [Candidatus Dojkabacteria bacterium]